MGNLAWAADTAKELLAEFGKDVTFYREVPDEPSDPSKPWRPEGIYPDPPTEYPAIAMTVPYAERYIDGTTVRRGDVRMYVAAKDLGFVPKVGDYCEFGGQKYKAVNVSIVEPGAEEDRVLYDVQVRG